MGTKERIRMESLNLFSKRGYEAVSMREIGRAAGIRESSIYKHYKGKQEILNAIIVMAKEEIDNVYKQLHIPIIKEETSSEDTAVMEYFLSMEAEEVADVCIHMALSLMENDIIVKTKRLLTIEQYRNEELKKLFQSIFMEKPLVYQEKVFSYLIKENVLVGGTAKEMALQFYAPFFMLEYRYEKEDDELKRCLKEHATGFIRAHLKEE